MTMHTKENLLSTIDALELDLATKEEIRNKIAGSETVDVALVGWIKAKIQEEIDTLFTSAGVADDEADPEYQAQLQRMLDEVDAAEKDFAKGMADIEKETKDLETAAAKQLDDVDAEAVASSIQDM